MKKKLLGIIGILGLASGVLGCGQEAVTNDGENKVNTDDNVQIEKHLEVAEGFKLEADLINTDIYIIEDESLSGDIRIVIEGESKDKIEVEQKSNGIKIIEHDEKEIGKKAKLTISVPAKYQFEEINIESVNGIVQSSNLNVKDFEVDGTNTNIKLSHIVSENIELETVNGNIATDNLSGKKIEVDTVSGNISGVDVYTDEVKLETVNGNIKLLNESDKDFVISKITTDTVNGDTTVDVKYDNYRKNGE